MELGGKSPTLIAKDVGLADELGAALGADHRPSTANNDTTGGILTQRDGSCPKTSLYSLLPWKGDHLWWFE